MEDFLRNWRQEALNRGQHDAAIYIGDKVLAFTTLQVLGEHNPAHLISTASNSRRKLQHRNESSHITLRNGKSTASRSDRIERNEEREREDASHIKFEAAMCYLRGLCYARQNAFDRARDCYKDAVRIDIQCFEAFEQLMKNSLMSPAEELEFLESLDFDSMNPSSDPSISQEAAEFVKLLYTTRLSKYSSPSAISHATETLSTHYNLAENPDLLLSRAETLYTQCRFPEALQLTSSILSSLDSDSMSAATSQGSQSRSIGHSPSVYPLHLACLYETGATNSLFLLAHTLADNAPEESYTYLAIGVYYLSVSKIAEARRFFSKASLLDPHSAPAWIGFAHTFAAEGEHDQAIAAYSTAARLFQGSHLPQLFLGMQHLALNNMSLAHEYLSAAYNMSSGSLSATSRNGSFSFGAGNMQPPLGGDPLVLNEVGVVLYHQANLEGAIEFFRRTLALAASLQCDPGAWLGSFEEALVEFDECLRIGAGGSTTGYTGKGGVGATLSAGSAAVGGYEDRGLTGSLHTARGLVLLELGRTMEAVTTLHEAVRVLGTSGGDAAAGAGVAGTLLSRALEIWALEEGDRDAAATASEHIETDVPTKSRPTAAKGKDVQKAKSSSRIGSRTRSRKTPLPAQEWTDDVINRESPNTPGGQRPASMELDDDADGLLNNALARIKSRHATRQRDVGLAHLSYK
ncbi:anaphase-promoting complex subunit Cut9 [Coccidioides immitis RMSCC 3703]|uniref:Anaphase-promoting complex subunit Cut9 n=1 Tax=Coccidioides immitis RMSCC 3703 TaxID=454286 RepID=A0A0J8QLB4_COCIT|nr:anaphase-promoting complex subunit Cut9 [Coccidioides immitis RMSCC 3703]